MFIRKIKIKNFKIFNGDIEIELNPGINILVGNNEAGKTTILEAVHIALTGMYGGRNIKTEISQYLFNKTVINEYIESVNAGNPFPPPYIRIEIYFEGDMAPEFEGNGNSDGNSCRGLKFEIAFNEKYNDEYAELIKTKSIISLPIEYYDASWVAFSREGITTRSIPLKSVMIDSTQGYMQGGSDVFISRIVKGNLDSNEIVVVSQAYRKMKEGFLSDGAIKEINKKINNNSALVDREVSLTVNLGTKQAWETSLVTQVDQVPFGYIGKGTQCMLKTGLALSRKRTQKARIILIEEPESHLSYSNLSYLVKMIRECCEDKQMIISTHSSFVANTLGLDYILLLSNNKIVRMGDLKSVEFFKKMAGYDTLRLILCKKAILVEGDSDELIIQRAYLDKYGYLPIEKQIDVISVGTSFLRFLEIAERLDLKVAVVTDNDGDVEAVKEKYKDYIDNKKENIKICYDKIVDSGDFVIRNKAYNYNTLEPKLLKANDDNLELFNKILDKNFVDLNCLRKYMKGHKTEVALAIFQSEEKINYPQYITEAIVDE